MINNFLQPGEKGAVWLLAVAKNEMPAFALGWSPEVMS